MPVDRVMAEIGLAADEPTREGRLRVVEHLSVGPVPVNELRLLAPEALAVLDRAAVEIAIGRHRRSLTLARQRFLAWIIFNTRSRRRSTSFTPLPRPAASSPSRSCSARSRSGGRRGGALGSGAAAAFWFDAACNRCRARRISSSIDFTASRLSDATPKLVAKRSAWPL